MKRQFQPFIENISEAAAACMVTMVQGNLLAITLGHWLIAAETGLIAGSIASAALVIWKTSKAWVVALVLGVVTTIVDCIVHPGGFGPAFLEAVVTGVGATALSFGIAAIVRNTYSARSQQRTLK